MGNGRHHRALFPPGELQWITEAGFIACVTLAGIPNTARRRSPARPPTKGPGREGPVPLSWFSLVCASCCSTAGHAQHCHRQSSGSAVSLHNGPAPEQQLMAVGYCSNESTRQVVYYTLEVAAEIELIIQVCCAVIIHATVHWNDCEIIHSTTSMGCLCFDRTVLLTHRTEALSSPVAALHLDLVKHIIPA